MVHGGRVRLVQTGLDERLASLARDHRLQLRRGEGVDVARLRGHQQHHLCPCKGAQFVRLQRERETACKFRNCPLSKKTEEKTLGAEKKQESKKVPRLTFFIIPDFLLEKVV